MPVLGPPWAGAAGAGADLAGLVEAVDLAADLAAGVRSGACFLAGVGALRGVAVFTLGAVALEGAADPFFDGGPDPGRAGADLLGAPLARAPPAALGVGLTVAGALLTRFADPAGVDRCALAVPLVTDLAGAGLGDVLVGLAELPDARARLTAALGVALLTGLRLELCAGVARLVAGRVARAGPAVVERELVALLALLAGLAAARAGVFAAVLARLGADFVAPPRDAVLVVVLALVAGLAWLRLPGLALPGLAGGLDFWSVRRGIVLA